MNLNKIQRSNERVSQDKDCLDRHNYDSLQNKRFASSLYSPREFWAGAMYMIELQKNMLIDKSSGD